jgi:hypothetical protein
MTTVLIRGDGIAATCCARLLDWPGFDLCIEKLDRPKLPAIMIGESTQQLLTDVFDSPDLFTGLPRIRRRVVAWGPSAKPVEVPHSAVVVSEPVLLSRIQQRLERNHLDQREHLERPASDWKILTSRPVQPSSVEHHFGSQIAAVSAVRLKPDCDSEACWVESIENGWLFLLPDHGGASWLLSVGDIPEVLLESSQLIRGQLSKALPPHGRFPCHPRIAEPLAGPGWMVCGTAAVGFDPLCGDGTGNAVREAILAAAVIRAARNNAEVDRLVAHYRDRVLTGFARHLKLCLDFYNAGHGGAWWKDHLSELERGLDWCAQKRASTSPVHYRLNGFVLEPID